MQNTPAFRKSITYATQQLGGTTTTKQVPVLTLKIKDAIHVTHLSDGMHNQWIRKKKKLPLQKGNA